MRHLIAKYLVFDYKGKTNLLLTLASVFIFTIPPFFILSLKYGIISTVVISIITLIGYILFKMDKYTMNYSIPRPSKLIFTIFTLGGCFAMVDNTIMAGIFASLGVIVFYLPWIYQMFFEKFNWNDLDESQKWQLGNAIKENAVQTRLTPEQQLEWSKLNEYYTNYFLNN